MSFHTKEQKYENRLKNNVLGIIEEIIHAPLDEMLSICADRLAKIFSTEYVCIHFTRDLGLDLQTNLPGLKH